MKVRCKYSNYDDIIPPLDPDYQYGIPHYLKKGHEYIVYGFYVLKKDGKILYYIIDESESLDSYVSDLFEIVDSQLPVADWHLGIGTELNEVALDKISLIFCYEEFVKSREHFEGVLEHEAEHLERFWKWKEIVDRQYYTPEDEWEMVKADVDGVDITFKRNRRTGEYEDFKFV